jgi:hypothetical protein
MNKCTCGRPAAKYPSLLFWLFHNAKAEVQRSAAWAHKCVPCYEIDYNIGLYLASRNPGKDLLVASSCRHKPQASSFTHRNKKSAPERR